MLEPAPVPTCHRYRRHALGPGPSAFSELIGGACGELMAEILIRDILSRVTRDIQIAQ